MMSLRIVSCVSSLDSVAAILMVNVRQMALQVVFIHACVLVFCGTLTILVYSASVGLSVLCLRGVNVSGVIMENDIQHIMNFYLFHCVHVVFL